MKKVVYFSILGLFIASSVRAHVVVNPKSVGVASRQNFTISVPTEKEVATVGLRLVLPAEIKAVTPNVKQGWKIEVKSKPTGKKIMDDDGVEIDETIETEIVWTGGVIPPGQRDEFIFATQVPGSVTNLNWKAYQTYADNTVVAWDQTPGGGSERPYSVTQVTNDLAAMPEKPSWWNKYQLNITLGLSLFALLLSLGMLLKKDNETKK
jgi:uncharacterized protein YcnI